jgi:phospholipase C
MNGFAASAKAINIDTSVPLSCFNPKTLPIMSTLASEFALFDAFYAAVPGPTEVNRMYMHSASSQGMGFNDLSRLLLGFPGRTIYHNVQDAGYTWNSYVDPVASSWVFTELRNTRYVNNYRAMPTFHADCKAGKLANYNFIEPRYFSLPLFPANDQHPSHSVAEGERLLKNIYESIRNSPQWNTTALIITYDEHGGFYDHMPTPVVGVPNPDNINSTKPPFDFKRLGVRIPMIVASPWIPKGLVVHEAGPAQMPTATSQYDTTSILATVKKMFGLPNFLTKRDAWASSFENIFSLNAPRSDCPTKLPAVPTQFFAKDLTTEPTQPLNDLQKTWITLGAALHGRSVNADEIPSEQEGGKLLEHFVKTYWEKDF